jgi:hypothetical protein
VPPVILRPEDRPAVAAAAHTEESAAVRTKPQKAKEKPHKKRRHVRKRQKSSDN